jgi:hypothetical protein
VIHPAVNDFAAANAHPDLSAVGAIFRRPVVACPIGSKKVRPSARNLDQQLPVSVGILAEVALRLSKYVDNPAFINRDAWHSQ